MNRISEAFAFHRSGDLESAIAAYREILGIDAGNGEARHALGVALMQRGDLDLALEHLIQAVRISPSDPAVHNSLGACRRKMGDSTEALAAFDQAVSLDPAFADALFNRGVVLAASNRFAEATESFLRAYRLNPQHAEACLEAANMLGALGRSREGLALLHKGPVSSMPASAFHFTRGRLRLPAGEFAGAREDFERVMMQRDERYHAAAVNRGVALRSTGLSESARDALEDLVRQFPTSVEARVNLALVYQDLCQYQMAEEMFRCALEMQHDLVSAHIGLASALLEMGRPHESLRSFLKASSIAPGNISACSGALVASAYLDDQGELARQTVTGGLAFSAQNGAKSTGHRAMRSSDGASRLRIGFVSGDFRDHILASFLESPLYLLDKSKFHLSGFSTIGFEDAATRRWKQLFDAWRVLPAADDAAAKLIADLEPDILIDLSGHTAHHRLSVFSFKPASIQVSWLGYWASTGLPQMDHIFVDPHAWRPADGEWFCESPWVLPESRLCFTPPADSPDVAELDPPRRGEVVFGCFSHPAKISDRVVAVWSRVLTELPESRLLLKARAYADPGVCKSISKRFERAGIAGNRLTFERFIPRGKYLEDYRRVHLILDTFPFPGGTTTAEALWMGVPVLTLSGNTLLSRQGESMLLNSGMPSWIAHSEQDFVEKAVGRALDIEFLRETRWTARSRLPHTPLFDNARFARHLTAALEGLARVSSRAHP